MISKRFLVLVEIAGRQPNIRQADIAKKLSITVQAVSEYTKRLIDEGSVESGGPLDYRVTHKGVEELLKGGRALREASRLIFEEIVKSKRVFAAIADCNIEGGEKVDLWMEGGYLKAGHKRRSIASGLPISSARKGEDVAITELEGIIELEKGEARILKMPSVENGGSRKVDYQTLKKEIKKGFVCALGIEAYIALKKIKKRPDAFFGSIETAVQACHHGISLVVVAAEREVPGLIEALTKENISYTVTDIGLG